MANPFTAVTRGNTGAGENRVFLVRSASRQFAVLVEYPVSNTPGSTQPNLDVVYLNAQDTPEAWQLKPGESCVFVSRQVWLDAQPPGRKASVLALS